MKDYEAIAKINEIADDVSANWTANDGGLTIAASDLLAFASNVVNKIESGDAAWLAGLDPFSADTGAEADITQIALEWAMPKMRRRIEDRLRKDDKFFSLVLRQVEALTEIEGILSALRSEDVTVTGFIAGKISDAERVREHFLDGAGMLPANHYATPGDGLAYSDEIYAAAIRCGAGRDHAEQ